MMRLRVLTEEGISGVQRAVKRGWHHELGHLEEVNSFKF